MTVFLLFGESSNDTEAIKHLIEAIAAFEKIAVRALPLRQPLVQQKSTTVAKSRTNAEKMAAVVKATVTIQKANWQNSQIVIVAHEDCDAVEPAHESVGEKIRSGLSRIGYRVVAAAPAFEMEAWWYIWPKAVSEVCSLWRPLPRAGTDVGLLVNAKQRLKSDLRPNKKGRPVRDYTESDAPSIAKNVKILGIINSKSAKSASYISFEKEIVEILQASK